MGWVGAAIMVHVVTTETERSALLRGGRWTGATRPVPHTRVWSVMHGWVHDVIMISVLFPHHYRLGRHPWGRGGGGRVGSAHTLMPILAMWLTCSGSRFFDGSIVAPIRAKLPKRKKPDATRGVSERKLGVWGERRRRVAAAREGEGGIAAAGGCGR